MGDYYDRGGDHVWDTGTTARRNKGYVVTGIIADVYEDLEPCGRVTINLSGGGTTTFDTRDLPFTYEELKASIGKRLTVTSDAKIEDA